MPSASSASRASGGSRADVAAVLYVGWDGIPVDCWVGATAQGTLYTAQDAFGRGAVQWQFYPEGEAWHVVVAPQLPAGLDAERWQYRVVRIDLPDSGVSIDNPSAASVAIVAGRRCVIYFQLLDTGALPQAH